MSEITLIEQNKKGAIDGLGGFYIRLTTDKKNQSFIASYKVMGVTVIETMGSGTPLVSIALMDTFGDLINHKIIEGVFEFYLYISNNDTANQRYRLLPSHINSMNATESRNDNQIYTIDLVSYHWPDMYLTRKNKSWRDKKYSDIVKEIAEEIGYQQINVTPTKEVIPNVIQPYWTNYQMLNWIKKRCVANQSLRTGHFDFCSTVDDGFFFMSSGDLVKSKNSGINVSEARGVKTLTMVQKAPNSLETSLRRAIKLEVEQNYMPMMVQGAGGVIPSHYDYMNKKYVVGDTAKFSESAEPQLSDWAFVSEEHEIGDRRIYSHSAMDDVGLAANLNSNAVNSIQKVKALIDGVSDIQMGEVVEVQIPLSQENSKIIFNENFSGFYTVSEKKIIVNLNTNNAQTILKLSRQGVNGAEVNTLIASSRGKSR